MGSPQPLTPLHTSSLHPGDGGANGKVNRLFMSLSHSAHTINDIEFAGFLWRRNPRNDICVAVFLKREDGSK